jgi:predicted alpha/beta-fold hydrolase
LIHHLDFEPFPGLVNPHVQTLLGAASLNTSLSSTQKLVELPDGDLLSLEISTPKKWALSSPTVVLVHGFCGSDQSAYLIRMAHRLLRQGLRAVRLNLRGCGSGKGLSKHSYHSGKSEDVGEALKALQKECPSSPLILLGYSLGGNIVLKLAGEWGQTAHHYLTKVIAVCPGIDIQKSVEQLGQKENWIYNWKFCQELREYALNLAPELPIPDEFTIAEFDNLFTAPLNGFADAQDYYNRASAVSVIPEIQIPCRILFSKDDPFISHTVLDHMPLRENIHIFKTERGGHLGFLGDPRTKRGYRWLDSLLLEWILE